MRWLLSAFLVAGMLLSMSGCSLFLRSQYPDLTHSRILDPLASESIKRRFVKQAEEVKRFRSLVSSVAKARFAQERLRQAVVFSRPGRLRIDFFGSSLNRLLGTIIVKDSVLTVVDAIARRGYQGPLEQGAIDSLVGIPLTPDELSLWFVGTFPFVSEGTLRRSELFFDSEKLQLTAKSTLSGGVVAFSRFSCQGEECSSPKLISISMFDSTDEQLLVKTDYRRDSLLSGMDVNYHAQGISFTFEFEEPEFKIEAGQIEERVFTRKLPRRYRRVPLSEITFLGR